MKPTLDGHKLIITSPPQGAVKTPITRIFLDRRVGITWPTAHNFGYFCVFGMEDKQTLYGKIKPFVLLAEGTDQRAGGRMPRRAFFGKLLSACHRYHSSWAFADMRREYDIVLWGLSEVVSKRNFELSVYDSSEWGGIEEMRPSVDELGERGLLDIPAKSIISGEMQRVTPDSLKSQQGLPVEKRFPAVYAMSQVVTSWEVYPWKKPTKKDKSKKQEGYR